MARSANRGGPLSQWDLLAAMMFASIAIAWGVIGDPSGAPFVLLAIPLLLFLPGYTITIVLFPYSEVDQAEDTAVDRGRTFAPFERAALSIGLSVLLLPLVGVVLAASPWGITQASAVIGIGAIAIVVSFAGIVRRLHLAPARRYRPRLPKTSGENRASFAVSVTLLASVILVAAVFGFTIAMPQAGDGSTDLYLLSADDGEPVAADYTETVPLADTIPLEVGIQNQEYEAVTYTLIVRLEAINEEGEVEASDELHEQEIPIADGDEWREELELSPTRTGEDLRLSFYLYEGEPRFIVGERTAYRHTYIWIDVPG